MQHKAKEGGSAEIHALGGTVRIDTEANPFDVFLKDPSRKLVVGDAGTIRFEFNMPVSEKKEAIKALIQQNRLVAAPGCRLTKPVIQSKMAIIRAEDERNESTLKTKKDLIAAIDAISDGTTLAGGSSQGGLESLLMNIANGSGNRLLNRFNHCRRRFVKLRNQTGRIHCILRRGIARPSQLTGRNRTTNSISEANTLH